MTATTVRFTLTSEFPQAVARYGASAEVVASVLVGLKGDKGDPGDTQFRNPGLFALVGLNGKPIVSNLLTGDLENG